MGDNDLGTLHMISQLANVEALYAATQEDNPDAMDAQAQGWANAADMFQQELDNLLEHREAVRGMWNSTAAAPYFRIMDETIQMISQAQRNAETKSEATSEIASNSRWAKERIAEEYEKWQAEKASPSPGKPPGLLEAGWNTLTSGSPSEAVLKNWNSSIEPDDERRKPFDEQARKYLEVANEGYEKQRPAILTPLPEYKPFGEMGLGPGKPGDPETARGGADSATGFAATSYGGNATGGSASPALQSGVPTTAASAPSAGTPHVGTPAPPAGGGVPVGGVPFAGKPATPTPSSSGSRTPTGARPGGGARRTPALPSNRSGGRPGGVPGRSGQNGRGSVPRMGNQAGRGNTARPGANGRTAGSGRGAGRNTTTGRNGAARPGTSARGPQKSQMAPNDRTGQVRRSGEVLGRRNKPQTQTESKAKSEPRAQQRQVPRGVIKGAKNQGKANERQTPADRTGRGYTSRVIGSRPRTEFTRTPLVAHKLDAAAGQRILGKRTPETEESQARQLIADRKDRRRALLAQAEEGLARPVISNGIVHSAQLDAAKPEPSEPVKAEDSFWQPESKSTVPGVIGKSRLDAGSIVHDPGPTSLQPAVPVDEAESQERHYHPGPTAFNGRQRPDTTNWP